MATVQTAVRTGAELFVNPTAQRRERGATYCVRAVDSYLDRPRLLEEAPRKCIAITSIHGDHHPVEEVGDGSDIVAADA